MPYSFAYDVNDRDSGNDFGHREQSDGSVVTGRYRVLLPDGRVQVVTYTADHTNGYQAQVEYEGEAKYDPVAPRRASQAARPASGQYGQPAARPQPARKAASPLPRYGVQRK